MRRRSACCPEEGVNRGAWSAVEDRILIDDINTYGEGDWRNVPKRAGLSRCGNSCRRRWLNYLHPDIKRGNFSPDEQELIIRLHNLLGNRWKLIAGRLPGRTDNEIKNYWNATLSKKVLHEKKCGSGPCRCAVKEKATKVENSSSNSGKHQAMKVQRYEVARPRAFRCTKVVFPSDQFDDPLATSLFAGAVAAPELLPEYSSTATWVDIFKETDMGDLQLPASVMDTDVYCDNIIMDQEYDECGHIFKQTML